MKRRTFIKTAGLTGMMLGLPRFSTAAEASKYAKTAPPVFDDYALNPARDRLRDYQLPTDYAPHTSQALTFKGFSFLPGRSKDVSNVANLGDLALRRTVASDRVRYEVKQAWLRSDLEGTVVCRPDAFRMPLEWALTAKPNAKGQRDLAALSYRGTVSQAGCRIQAGPLDQTVALDHGATLLWNLLDSGEAMRDLKQPVPVDMFWDGLVARPSLTLENDGYTVLPGSQTPIKTVMLHGPAMMPQHFLVTEGGIPIGVTGFLVSWILTNVEDIA